MPETALEKLVVEIEKAGEEWCEAKLKADQLEEGKKSVLAGLKLDSGKSSDAARETEALASDEYRQYLAGMVQASNEALRKRVRYDNLVRFFEAKRSQFVTEREVARTLGAKT